MKFAFSMFVLKLTLRGVFEMRIKVNWSFSKGHGNTWGLFYFTLSRGDW